jgi:hypothetical protein
VNLNWPKFGKKQQTVSGNTSAKAGPKPSVSSLTTLQPNLHAGLRPQIPYQNGPTLTLSLPQSSPKTTPIDQEGTIIPYPYNTKTNQDGPTLTLTTKEGTNHYKYGTDTKGDTFLTKEGINSLTKEGTNRQPEGTNRQPEGTKAIRIATNTPKEGTIPHKTKKETDPSKEEIAHSKEGTITNVAPSQGTLTPLAAPTTHGKGATAGTAAKVTDDLTAATRIIAIKIVEAIAATPAINPKTTDGPPDIENGPAAATVTALAPASIATKENRATARPPSAVIISTTTLTLIPLGNSPIAPHPGEISNHNQPPTPTLSPSI